VRREHRAQGGPGPGKLGPITGTLGAVTGTLGAVTGTLGAVTGAPGPVTGFTARRGPDVLDFVYRRHKIRLCT